MLIGGRSDRTAAILAGTLGLFPLPSESAPEATALRSAEAAIPLTSAIGRTKLQTLLAQVDDLAPPPSPDALVTTPPPAPVVEVSPPPLPGYVWSPGHWTWDGGQYVWRPGNYIAQPTNGATFTPGYWQQFSGGWAWVEGRWSWETQGE